MTSRKHRCERCRTLTDSLMTLALPSGGTVRLCARCHAELVKTLGLAPVCTLHGAFSPAMDAGKLVWRIQQ